MTAQDYQSLHTYPTSIESLQQQLPASQSAPNLTILLVDDITENLELLEETLSEHGYSVLMANGGYEALDLLRMVSVDVIVADAMMPRMDGFQLCKTVKEIEAYAHIPYIIYTGDYVDQEDVAFAKKLGADRYVMKTGGFESLIQAVNEVTQQYHGFHSPVPTSRPAQIDHHAFLEHHNAVLIRKLEQKMLELEMYAETLARKNRALEESEARYRSLIEHAGIAIYVLDRATGKVIDVNKQGIALLGYAKRELKELPHFSLFPLLDREAMVNRILHTTEYLVMETQLQTFHNEVLDVEVGVAPIDQPHDERLVLFVRDVTEQKKMKEQMLQVEKMSLMGRLVSGIAHEIRNPLSATTLHLQYLLQKFGADFSEYDSLEAAFEGAQRIQQVIDRTLSLARPTPPILKPEQVNDIVERTLWFVKIAIQQKQLTIKTRLGKHLPPIIVDAKQIQQAMLNIVQNAIDVSMANGIIEITTYVEHDVRGLLGDKRDANKPSVVVAVRDYGCGIPEEQSKHLFEPFRTTKPGGTGLGLTLTKYILDRHGAHIAVLPADGPSPSDPDLLEQAGERQSRAGSGTIVYLIFPVSNNKGGPLDVQSERTDSR